MNLQEEVNKQEKFVTSQYKQDLLDAVDFFEEVAEESGMFMPDEKGESYKNRADLLREFINNRL